MSLNNMKISLFAVLALSILSCPSFAQGPASLQTLIDTARQNNPEIKAAQKAYQSADSGIVSMSAWSNPLAGYEFMKDNNRLYLSQGFSFPGKLSYKKTSVTEMSRSLNMESRQTTLQVDTKVKKAFWGYWLAYKNINSYNKNITLMKRFLETAKSKYIVGKVTEADVLAAKAELGRMQGMLVSAEYEKDSMQSELNALMDKNSDDPLGVPEIIERTEVSINYAKLEQKVLADNFELAAKKYVYQSALADSKLSSLEWLPDLMTEARISDVSDKSTYMVSVQVPLYFWGRLSEVRSRNLRSETERQTLEAQKNSVRLALKDMYLQYNRNIKLIKIYETDILPSAKQAVEISESGYRAGKMDFLYILELQKKYLDFEIEYNRLSAEYKMYYAELEMIAGGSVE